MANSTQDDGLLALMDSMDVFGHAASVKTPSVKKPKKTQYSYSRLDKYCECGYRYKLTYEDGNYIDEPGVAAAVGTLVHHIEEEIAGYIMAGEPIPYDDLRKEFFEINIPEKKAEYDSSGHKKKGSEGGIYGVNELKKRYVSEFFELDNQGTSYFAKCQEYATSGIYRLQKYMDSHPELEIVAVEKEFFCEFNGFALHGYIDRVLRDKETGEYILEDIKTKGKPFDESKLKTPLQFVVYAIAAAKEYGLSDYPTRFHYDLVFCDMRQDAGTKGCIARGFAKLEKIFSGITSKQFVPHPSPLCYWCEFCDINPHRPEAGRAMCPYYSLWTPGGAHKAYETNHKWEGPEAHEAILEEYRSSNGLAQASAGVMEDLGIKKPAKPAAPKVYDDFDF